MMNQKQLLNELCKQGKPLAEIGIVPSAGEDIYELINLINRLGPDIEVTDGRYNDLIRDGKLSGHTLTIEGDATQEALERLFGWVIVRTEMPKWDAANNQYDGVHKGFYYWQEKQPPQYYPDSINGQIKEMGLSQPETNDNGNDDTITYVLPSIPV